MRTMGLAVVCLAAALLVGGCGGTADAGSQPVTTNQVSMAKSYRFDPVTIRVVAGSTVTWHNDDNFTHDVRLTGDGAWRSEPVAPGQSTTYTFAQPGEYPYECGFHPQNMKGTVIVGAQ